MANTAGKPNFFKRMGKWFANLGKRIAHSFKNMAFELRKVTWPTKKEMINYSVVVLIFIVVMGIIIGLFDLGASALVELITKA